MNSLVPIIAVIPLRQRLIDEMEIRRFGRDTQRNYIRDVGRFATWLGRSPDTATAEDVRRFQVEQCDLGVPVPTMNAIVFLHPDARPARPGAQAGPHAACTQAAGGGAVGIATPYARIGCHRP